MRTEAEIHNDYFTCQFVLSFPVAGIHRVNITTGNARIQARTLTHNYLFRKVDVSLILVFTVSESKYQRSISHSISELYFIVCCDS